MTQFSKELSNQDLSIIQMALLKHLAVLGRNEEFMRTEILETLSIVEAIIELEEFPYFYEI